MVLVQSRSSARHTGHTQQQQLNPIRVTAIAGTVLVNGIVLMALMQPMKLHMPMPVSSIQFIELSERAPPPPLPPPQIIDRVPVVPIQPPATQRAPDRLDRDTDTAPRLDVTVSSDTTPVDTVVYQAPAGPVDAGTVDSSEAAPGGPVEGIHLSYALAPAPTYPRSELRAGVEGTVLLKILVDTDGTPLAVDIHQSSGNRRLDATARRHVFEHWRFHPAMRDGQAVQAIGIVPIEFRLH